MTPPQQSHPQHLLLFRKLSSFSLSLSSLLVSLISSSTAHPVVVVSRLTFFGCGISHTTDSSTGSLIRCIKLFLVALVLFEDHRSVALSSDTIRHHWSHRQHRHPSGVSNNPKSIPPI